MCCFLNISTNLGVNLEVNFKVNFEFKVKLKMTLTLIISHCSQRQTIIRPNLFLLLCRRSGPASAIRPEQLIAPNSSSTRTAHQPEQLIASNSSSPRTAHRPEQLSVRTVSAPDGDRSDLLVFCSCTLKTPRNSARLAVLGAPKKNKLEI